MILTVISIIAPIPFIAEKEGHMRWSIIAEFHKNRILTDPKLKMIQSRQLLDVSRSEKHNTEEIKKNTCFICGLERKDFDNKNVTFEVQSPVET